MYSLALPVPSPPWVALWVAFPLVSYPVAQVFCGSPGHPTGGAMGTGGKGVCHGSHPPWAFSAAKGPSLAQFRWVSWRWAWAVRPGAGPVGRMLTGVGELGTLCLVDSVVGRRIAVVLASRPKYGWCVTVTRCAYGTAGLWCGTGPHLLRGWCARYWGPAKILGKQKGPIFAVFCGLRLVW